VRVSCALVLVIYSVVAVGRSEVAVSSAAVRVSYAIVQVNSAGGQVNSASGQVNSASGQVDSAAASLTRAAWARDSSTAASPSLGMTVVAAALFASARNEAIWSTARMVSRSRLCGRTERAPANQLPILSGSEMRPRESP
jgi:hypothetical protein